MTFDIKKMPMYLIAKAPIHHGGDQETGSETMFRRLEYIINNQSIAIPIIHANALRGIWRRLIMDDLAKLLDMGYKDDAEFQVSKDVYQALFTGGNFKSVGEKDSGKIYIQFKRDIRKYVPPIKLLGTAFMTQQIESIFSLDQIIPICEELYEGGYLPDDIPDEFQDKLNLSVFEFMEFMYQTRRDTIGEKREEGEQAIQMYFKYEVMKPGTILQTNLKLVDYNEIDLSCLARILELWRANPIIGAHGAVGLGRVDPQIEIDATSDTYVNYIKDNRDEIIEFLTDL
jgi:hypothetical protein